MGYICDFCSKNAEKHKLVCEKCFPMLLRLLDMFEEKKETLKEKVGKKKKKRKKKLLRKKLEKVSEKKQKPSKVDEKVLKVPKNPEKNFLAEDNLKKCRTCEFGFLDSNIQKIGCTEGKEPKTCGQS